MDPVLYYRENDGDNKFFHLLDDLALGGPPIEVWQEGNKVAVVITPEEFDLLNRLVREDPNG